MYNLRITYFILAYSTLVIFSILMPKDVLYIKFLKRAIFASYQVTEYLKCNLKQFGIRG